MFPLSTFTLTPVVYTVNIFLMTEHSGRTAYHHGDLRRALVEATARLVDAHGPGGFSLRAAAREAGVSHAAPYRHFADKEALLAAVVAWSFDELAVRSAEAIAGAEDPLDALRRAALAYVCWALDHPQRFRLMFGDQVDRTAHPDAKAAAGRTFTGVEALVRSAQDAGLLRDGDPAELARISWSLFHGVARLALDGQFRIEGRQAQAEFVERAARALLEGIGYRRSPADPEAR